MSETLEKMYATMTDEEKKKLEDFAGYLIYMRNSQSNFELVEKVPDEKLKKEQKLLKTLAKFKGSCKGAFREDALEYQKRLREDREIG